MDIDTKESIAAIVDKLRKRHKHNVSIKRIKGKLYVYEQTTKRDPSGRIISYNLYLGKIEDSGKFTEAKHRKPQTRVYNLDQSIKFKERARTERKDDELVRPDSIDIEILKMLSADGRTPVSYISKKIGLSNVATKYRIKRLEEKYGIRYTLQFESRPFGFFRYAILIRFKGEKPERNAIRTILEKDPMVQTVVFTKGAYDLFIYLFAENTKILEDKIYNLRLSDVFAPYKAYWYVNYITDAYGYIPIRDAFFELLKEKIWKRTRETPRRLPGQILEREYLVLKELNLSGNIDFTSLDKRLGLGKGSSQYTYYKLIESNIIASSTITMEKPPMRYLGFIYCIQLDFDKYKRTRKYSLLNILEETKLPTNKYILSGDVGSPYGFLRIAPIYEEGGLDKMEYEINKRVKGLKIRTFVGTDVIIGTFGYRKLDSRLTLQYENLIKYYGSTETKET